MKYKFQHFIDISTSAESMQSLTFSVGGEDVIKRCAHLFNAYKYFKLGKITVKFVPASTLPVDPLGMGYGDTDPQTVDPRDQLNPGVVRIINGEDIQTGDLSMGNYEAMLLDPRWYKFSLQSGFKRSAYPLYWQIGQIHQDQWPGATVNVPTTAVVSQTLNVPSTLSLSYGTSNNIASASGSGTAAPYHYAFNVSDDKGLFQVGHRGRMGWLPTDAYQRIYNGDVEYTVPMVHPVPQVRVIQCFLPKAYKTLYYYRVYITEEVSFSGLKSIAPYTEIESSEYNYRSPDVFIRPPDVTPAIPSTGITQYAGTTLLYQQMNDGSDTNGSD